MSEQQINIKLHIAGKTYERSIDPRNEEIYRLAAREINTMLTEAQQVRIDGFSIQDYLVMVALNAVSANIRLERRNSVEDGDLQALSGLAKRLSKHLEK